MSLTFKFFLIFQWRRHPACVLFYMLSCSGNKSGSNIVNPCRINKQASYRILIKKIKGSKKWLKIKTE